MKRLREIRFESMRLYTEEYEVVRESLGKVRKSNARLPNFGMNYNNRLSIEKLILFLKNMFYTFSNTRSQICAQKVILAKLKYFLIC